MKKHIFIVLFLFCFNVLFAGVKATINKQSDPSSGTYFLIIFEFTDIQSYLDHVFIDVHFLNGVEKILVNDKYKWESASVYKPGDKIYHKDGYQINAQYFLVSAENSWYSGQDLRLELKVYPNISGKINFQYRASRSKVVGTTYTTVDVYPTSGTKDEQGWYVKTGSQTHDGDGSKPDVIARNIVVNEGGTVYENTSVIIKAVGEEINNTSAGSVNFGLYIDGNYDNQYYTTTLTAGDDDPLTFTRSFSKGRHKVEVVADYDGKLSEKDETNNSTSIYIDVISLNTVPTVTITNVNVVDNAATVYWQGSDTEGDALTYYWTLSDGQNSGGWVTTTSKTFSNLANGTYTFSVTAKDSKEAQSVPATRQFQISVNKNPVLSFIGNKTVNENVLLSFTVSASDPDGDPVTITTGALPQGAAFTNNVFSWTPTFLQSGSYQVAFTASDGKNGTASETITITVVDIPNESVVLTTPNGDEYLRINKVFRITWNVTNTPSEVSIYLSRDNKATWGEILPTRNLSVNYYDWTVTGPPSRLCFIKVVAKIGGNKYEDISDKLFSIISDPGGPVETWPLSGEELYIQMTQDGEAEIKVEVGKAQNIQSLTFKVVSENANDQVDITVYDPSGSSVISKTVFGMYQETKQSPKIGTWKIFLKGKFIIAGGTRVSVIMQNPYLSTSFQSINYRQVGVLGKTTGVLLSGYGGTVFSVAIGLVTGVCADDDLWCMGSDLSVGMIPVIGTVKDVVQLLSSGGMGTIMSFSPDPLTRAKAKTYFNATGFAAIGVACAFVGFNSADELLKWSKFIAKTGRFGKIMKPIGDLGPMGIKIIEASKKTVVRDTPEMLGLLKYFEKWETVDIGKANEARAALIALGHPDDIFELVQKVGKDGQVGLSVPFYAKLKPGADKLSDLEKWDFSTARFDKISNEFYEVTDVDVLLREKSTGKYVPLFVKSSDGTSKIEGNSLQIKKWAKAVEESPEMAQYRNFEPVAIADNGLRMNKTTGDMNDPTELAVHQMYPTIVKFDKIQKNAKGKTDIYFYTESEEGNAGIYIYRRKAGTTVFEKISPLILGYGADKKRHDYVFTDETAIPGNYEYTIMQVHTNGYLTYQSEVVSFILTGINGEKELPNSFSLYQNYPNPFNPTTSIQYSLEKSTFVHLAVYSMIGQEIAVLVHKEQTSGLHEVVWSADNLTSGTYVYVLQADGKREVKKAVFLK